MLDTIDLISLLPVIISVGTLVQLAKSWSQFWDDKVILADQQLAQQLAIFVLLPIGVLLHEIGHSLATWQVGGIVKTFRWYFFSGYIIPTGDFSLAEYWWIVFAGNLVSILLALLSIFLITKVRKRIVSEVLYFFACIQSIYALIAYPASSLLTGTGDWTKIYNLNFQPQAPFTLVAHLILLWKLWQIYHSQEAIQWRLARNPQTLMMWKDLESEPIKRPGDLQPLIDLAYFLGQRREIHAAKKIAAKIDHAYPHSDQVRVFRLVMTFYQKADHRVIEPAQKLLNRDLLLEDRLRLYRILCISCLNTNQSAQALEYANQGLAIAPNDYKLRYNRASVYKSYHQYQKAIADLDIAKANCPEEEMQEWIVKFQQQCQQKLR
ncbi:MAG: M50 family metallopeptidase [Cyanobacteria bacterium P01_G01_bin.39]